MDIVRTDVEVIRRLPEALAGASATRRKDLARRAIALVGGEFLADLRYEPWAPHLQLLVNNVVRARLLPIAQQRDEAFDLQLATDAASALAALDPFDETAALALADCLERSGRRVAARGVVLRYARLVRAEFDEDTESQVSTTRARLAGQE
jgi:DNA-binding SARP family transcriptional activator